MMFFCSRLLSSLVVYFIERVDDVCSLHNPVIPSTQYWIATNSECWFVVLFSLDCAKTSYRDRCCKMFFVVWTTNPRTTMCWISSHYQTVDGGATVDSSHFKSPCILCMTTPFFSPAVWYLIDWNTKITQIPRYIYRFCVEYRIQ